MDTYSTRIRLGLTFTKRRFDEMRPARTLAFIMIGLLCSGLLTAADPEIVAYDDFALSGGSQAGHFPEIWDLWNGGDPVDLVLTFTYDGNGLVDTSGSHAWAEFGAREVCYGDFNPTWQVEGAGVWLTTDYDWTDGTFDPDPPGAPTQDIDDKLMLQKGGGLGEASYDLPSAPPNPWANHAVWFDRDGVDPFQALMWGAVDGVTYNTGGIYEIVITLHADSATQGTAFMTVNGEPQGFYDPGWHPGPADLMPAGMTFTGDMTQMQVFSGLYGYGETHSVGFTDIEVSGFPAAFTRAPCLEIAIDIKPGSCPNSINLKSKGKLPVAILTTDTFDATTVDPVTVVFAGAAPLKWAVEDVDGDGDLDLIFHFATREVDLDGASLWAFLDGFTFDGAMFWGTDTVNIVKE